MSFEVPGGAEGPGKSYYDILGVPKDADEKTLKSAYRKKAMEYHPDRNPGSAVAEAKFKEIGEAYEVLSDPLKRQTYDRFGKQGQHTGPASSPGSPTGDVFDSGFWGKHTPRGYRSSSSGQAGSTFNFSDIPSSEQKTTSPPQASGSDAPLVDLDAYAERKKKRDEGVEGFFAGLFKDEK